MKASTIQFLQNAGIFSSVFIIPVFARDLGIDEFQLGLIVALFFLSLLVSNYVFGRWADVHGRRRILQLGLLLTALASATQMLAHDATTLAIARILVGLSAGLYPAALYAYVYDSKGKIGKFSSFGSLGWGVSTICAGILAIFWQIFLLSSFFLFLAFVVALFLTPMPEVKLKVPFFPKDVIKRNLPVYLAVLVRHTGAHAIWVIFPLFLLDLKMDLLAVGVLYAVNSGTQFVVMQLADRFESSRLVATGLLISTATFISFTFAQNFWHMFPTQILLGASWGTIYVGSLKFVMEKNVERGTSTGLLNSVLSISAIIGPLLGGMIVGGVLSLGFDLGIAYRSTMWVAALMAVVSFFLFLSALKRNNG